MIPAYRLEKKENRNHVLIERLENHENEYVLTTFASNDLPFIKEGGFYVSYGTKTYTDYVIKWVADSTFELGFDLNKPVIETEYVIVTAEFVSSAVDDSESWEDYQTKQSFIQTMYNGDVDSNWFFNHIDGNTTSIATGDSYDENAVFIGKWKEYKFEKHLRTDAARIMVPVVEVRMMIRRKFASDFILQLEKETKKDEIVLSQVHSFIF